MLNYSLRLRHLIQLTAMLLALAFDALCFLGLCLRPSPTLAAENLFLRKQLALYQERNARPRRTTDATRIIMAWLGRWFDWRQAVAVVQPGTFLRWHRQGFRLFWRWRSRPGRARIPAELQALIRQMARENPTWGQERIANELLLKLGLRVSPRTVRTSTCQNVYTQVQANALNPNAGPHLSGIMPRGLSPVTSALWSPRPFVSSTSLSSSNMPAAACCTSMSRCTPQPSGPSNNSAKRFRLTTRTGS